MQICNCNFFFGESINQTTFSSILLFFTSNLCRQVDEHNDDRYVHPDSETVSWGHVSPAVMCQTNPPKVFSRDSVDR